MEAVIQNYHFTKCSNNKCNAIYPLVLEDVKNSDSQFCPKCKNALSNSHLVFCENCQNLVSFIPLFIGEEAVFYYVPKCTMCFGTIKDEQRLAPQYFPKSFI